MFQRKRDERFKKLPNVCGIAHDNLIVGYDNNGADHDRTLCRVYQICKKEILKLNKGKCISTAKPSHFLQDYLQARHETRLEKTKGTHQHATSKVENRISGIHENMNYLSKLSPPTVESCELLQRLTSVKWNGHGTVITKTYLTKQNH